MKNRIFFILIIGMLLTHFSSGAHYIVGIVNDAKDGTSSNGLTISLWNTERGLEDNLTDIIGPYGNSKTNNVYMIDCEMLKNPCNVGDNLSVRVFNNGNNYVSDVKSVIVTGNGFDVVENLSLNSPPKVFLISPENYFNSPIQEILFNFSVNDYDANLVNVSLYGNWSVGWHINETKESSENGYFSFTKNLEEGVYEYSCIAIDSFFISQLNPENYSFVVDLTKPNILSIYPNESLICGDKLVRVNCTVVDNGGSGIQKVIIQSIFQNSMTNYSGIFLNENTYYSDILVNKSGEWKFNCIVNDTAGNINNLTSSSINRYPEFAELYINYSSIFFNKINPSENERIIINATIENLGCGNAENVLIGLFNRDPKNVGKGIENKSLSINGFSSQEINFSWDAEIGKNNLFIVADLNNSFDEENESNNEANKTFSVNSWQIIYGNITLSKILGGLSFNLTNWINESNFTGNVFITDSECEINWLTLQSIGKTNENEESSNDFFDIDYSLEMEEFDDSVSILFSEEQNPIKTDNFLVHQIEIKEVPIIESGNNSNFITGMLWDFSDDSGNKEYDAFDKEDIVFVTKVKKGIEGNYGMYDYEIKIPAKIREYKGKESSEIYFYYDLN